MAAAEGAIEFQGFVEDVLVPLSRYGVFVCPILSGSGVRVKLLEAFAMGIPVVSTTLGAEGLTDQHGKLCALADAPAEFADRITDLLQDQAAARQMAQRARAEVETNRDITVLTRELVSEYRRIIQEKREQSTIKNVPQP